MTRLQVTVLGGFAARLGGRPLPLPGSKARALLAYLAMRAGHAHQRERLADMLWRGAHEARARDSLRHALGALRVILPGRLLVDQRPAVTLEPTSVEVDAIAFERLVAKGTAPALARAATLYAGDFLDGLDVADEGPFRDWLLGERARFRELAVSCLGRLVALRSREGRIEPALRTARRLLEIDPLDEAAHRAIMRLHARQGRSGAALRQYQACAAALERELGTEPAPETRALYRALLRPAAGAAERPPDRPPSRVRGHASTVAAGSPGERVPLVGRDVERARLGGALDAAVRGSGRVVVILGEAGVGKTSLVEEAVREAVRRRTRLMVGRSHETERILPFGPWVEALRSGGVGSDPRELDGLGRAWRLELARLLPEVDQGAAASLQPGRDPLRLLDGVVQLVRLLASTRPLGVVLEDLHWADDMSVRLCAFLARRIADLPVFLLATARDDEAGTQTSIPGLVQEIRREPGATIIALAPLDRAGTFALVRALADPGTPPARLDALAERVWEMSEGNPFVVRETMQALGAGGASGDPLRASLPRRVRDLVAARLDRLSGPALEAASLGAVVGRVFAMDLVCRTSRLSDAEVAGALEELVRARVLREVDDGLAFVHERVREVALERLPAAKRALLHRRVAEALEATAEPDREPSLAALAAHFRLGEVWAKAVDYLARLAGQAARRYAMEEAVAALRDARDLAARLPPGERDSRALDLALRLAHSLYFLGRHDESRALLLAEQARLARAGDARLRGRYHFLLARSAGLAGDNAEAERRARLAIEDAERANDASTLGQAHYLLAHEAYWTGRSRDGVGHAERAIRFLERAEERWWLGQGWWILSVNLGLLGEFGRALEAVRRCRHAGDALGDPRLQSYAAWTEGWLLAARGETDRGVELCRLAAELAPDPVSRLNARQALAYAWLEAGRNDAAIAELEPVVADLARLGVRRPEGLFTAFLGEAYRARGQLDQARAAATGALESTVALGYGYAAGLAERTLARIALDEGDPATAVKLAGGALGSFVAIGARFEEARTRLDLGEMYRALGRQVDAAREARTAADLLAALDAPRHLRLAESLAGSLGQGGVRERLPAPPERAAAPADPDRARAAQAGSG